VLLLSVGAAGEGLVFSNLNTKYIKDMPAKKGSHVDEDEEEFGADECREALAIVPLLVVINIGFNLSYNAMNNAFPASACQMNTMLGGDQLNGAFFNIADAIAIIVFTPLFESCLFPVIAKMKGSPVRIGQKIVAGLMILTAALLLRLNPEGTPDEKKPLAASA